MNLNEKIYSPKKLENGYTLKIFGIKFPLIRLLISFLPSMAIIFLKPMPTYLVNIIVSIYLALLLLYFNLNSLENRNKTNFQSILIYLKNRRQNG